MKKYVTWSLVTETSGTVTSVIYTPVKEQEAEDGNGFYTDTGIPQPDDLPGMTPTLMIRLPEKELYYDYAKVTSVEKQITELKQADLDNKDAIAGLVQLVMSQSNVT